MLTFFLALFAASAKVAQTMLDGWLSVAAAIAFYAFSVLFLILVAVWLWETYADARIGADSRSK